MALVNSEFKYIFLHIPKVAGMSIEQALGVEHHSSHHGLGNLPSDPNNYFSFCFVRDPTQRFISCCNYYYSVAVRNAERIIKADEKLNKLDELRYEILVNALNLDEIASKIIDQNLHKSVMHFRPQINWIINGSPRFIGRFETLDKDFSTLKRILDHCNIGDLPRINQSIKKFTKNDLTSIVENKLRDIYADDYKYLGY